MNDDKNKKIDLKMNINRYNIKYYVSNFADNFSDQDVKYERVFSARQLRTDSYMNSKIKKFNTSRISSKRMNSLLDVFSDKNTTEINKMNLNCDAIQSKTEANDFFSTLNKDIILIQTNKIKSNYLESIGNDMYQKLFFYIEEHNISYIKKAIDDNIANININHQDSKGNTFLNNAVRFNFDEIIEFLLRLGANPNLGNKELNYPLHYALSAKKFEIANLLINYGALEDVTNVDRLNPWQCVGKVLK